VKRPLGVANLPPEAVLVTTPQVARFLLVGVRLAVLEQRRNGAALPAEFVEGVIGPLRRLAEWVPQSEPVLDVESSVPVRWLSVRTASEQLGVTEEYVRRLARVELLGVGLARKNDRDTWELAEEGVNMIDAKRKARAA
jgi:hypothetical protein